MALSSAQRKEFRETVRPLIENAVGEVLRARDAGERELRSRSVAPPALLDGPDEFVSEVLDVVASAPRGPELLAGMAVASPTRIAVGARVRLEELADAPAPLGLLAVVEAWELTAQEPVTATFALCTREGAAGAQLFSFVIETDVSSGAIRNGFVTGTSEGKSFVKTLRARPDDGAELRPFDPNVAFESIVAAARRGAASGLAPDEDGLAAVTIFLRAAKVDDADTILAALELGDSLEAHLDARAFVQAVTELAVESETWFRDQGLPPQRVDAAALATGLMADFRADYLGLDADAWVADELDEFLLDWVPRKVSLDDDEVDEFPGAVADAFLFLGATGRMAGGEAAELSTRALGHGARFIEAMGDPARVGPAGAIIAAMRADGVEVGDEEAVQAWIDEFNARTRDERDAVLGSALPAPATRPSPSRKTKTRKAQKLARRRNRGR
jgi:hypothetical protein